MENQITVKLPPLDFKPRPLSQLENCNKRIDCRERQLAEALGKIELLECKAREDANSFTSAEQTIESWKTYSDLLKYDLDALKKLVNSPETDDFFKGIELEAAHQRTRWPSEQDAGKTHADWFWLVGYLAGKCLHAAISGDREKALHHTISTAAALANWHRAIKGAGNMRPGIADPKEGDN